MEAKYILNIGSQSNKVEPKQLPIDHTKGGDPFYRYKMRQLFIYNLGRGKMVKTIFINIEDVAVDLDIPPSYILNFIAKSIGAKFEKNTISGFHSVEIFSNALFSFIKKVILCRQCQLPELDFKKTKKTLRIKCKSCGWRGKLDDLNLDEKISRYMCSHPPEIKQHKKEKTKHFNKQKVEKISYFVDWNDETKEFSTNVFALQGSVAAVGSTERMMLDGVKEQLGILGYNENEYQLLKKSEETS